MLNFINIEEIMTIKNSFVKLSILITVFIVISISACLSSWQGDTAELIISVSGANRSAVYDPKKAPNEKLDHEVTLTNGKETLNFTFNAGETLEAVVSPGNWNVRVDSYLKGDIYATGSKPVVLKLGQNYETIDMENAIKVSFNSNGGNWTNKPEPIVIKVNGGKITLPDGSGLSRNGYTFDSWNTNANGTGTTYRAGDTYTNNSSNKSNVTLYAKWVVAKNVTFNSVSQNGSSSQTTTQLTLIFSEAITGLSASDITLSGVSVSNKTLTGSGPSYTLTISGFTTSGTLNVAVAKSGYTINDSPRTVTIYYYVVPPPPSGWTVVASNLFNGYGINSIAWGNGKFVAVGGNGKMAYSSDGIEWTVVADSKFGTSNIKSIAWGNGIFVAGGNDGKMSYSPDGINWTAVADNKFTGYHIRSIAWGNGKFFAVGSGDLESVKMVYSEDGIYWATVMDSNFYEINEIFDIEWGNNGSTVNKFVAVGDYGQVANSSNGITWTVVSENLLGPVNRIFDIAWVNNKFFAVGDNGKMAYSSDGIEWTAVEDSKFGTSTITNIAWGNNKFVAVGDFGKMAYSPDGITWSAITELSYFQIIYGIAWGNDKFVAVGGAGDIAYWYGN
jgi:hypothetical protein